MDEWVSKRDVTEGVCRMLRECFGADDEMLDAIATTVGEQRAVRTAVIRCKDCTHRRGSYCMFKDFYGTYVHDYDFCSNAERGEDAGI